jgi:hypothetical protein
LIDDVGDLFHELMSGLVKIQFGVHVDGDFETTTDAIKKEINMS